MSAGINTKPSKQGGLSLQQVSADSPSPKGRRQDFGRRLRDHRHAARITQDDLAWSADIDHTYLSKVETGATDPPSEITICRLARCLGVDPTELLILAGKVPSDLVPIITGCPEVVEFLRAASHLTPGEWSRLTSTIPRQSDKLPNDPRT